MFNKETEYALRGLVYIKLQNLKVRRPGTAEVAKEIGAPPFFTAKILQRLVGLVFWNLRKVKAAAFSLIQANPICHSLNSFLLPKATDHFQDVALG